MIIMRYIMIIILNIINIFELECRYINILIFFRNDRNMDNSAIIIMNDNIILIINNIL